MRSVLEKITFRFDDNNKPTVVAFSNFHPFFEELQSLCMLYCNDNGPPLFKRTININLLPKIPIDVLLLSEGGINDNMRALKFSSLIRTIYNVIYPAPHTIGNELITEPLSDIKYNSPFIDKYLFYTKANQKIFNIQDVSTNVLPLFLHVDKYDHSKTGNSLISVLINSHPMSAMIYDQVLMSNIHYNNQVTFINYDQISLSSLMHAMRGSKCVINTSYSAVDIFPFLVAIACGTPIISVPNIHLQEYLGENNIPTFTSNKELPRILSNEMKPIWQKQYKELHNYDFNNVKTIWDKEINDWMEFI
jgi:hypothetical protein